MICQGANALAYWAHLLVMKVINCCKYGRLSLHEANWSNLFKSVGPSLFMFLCMILLTLFGLNLSIPFCKLYYFRYLRKVDCSSFVLCLLLALPLPSAYLQQPLRVVTRQTRQAEHAINQSIF
jgi:hypothetical protein